MQDDLVCPLIYRQYYMSNWRYLITSFITPSCLYTPSQGLDWVLCVVLPRKDFMATVNQSTLTSIYSSLVYVYPSFYENDVWSLIFECRFTYLNWQLKYTLSYSVCWRLRSLWLGFLHDFLPCHCVNWNENFTNWLCWKWKARHFRSIPLITCHDFVRYFNGDGFPYSLVLWYYKQ